MKSLVVFKSLLWSFLWSFLWLSLPLGMLGCATSSDMQFGSEPDNVGGNPNPAAYGMDAFTVRKWQKRRPATDAVFFFKKCSVMDGRSYWSKTSYDCSEL